MELSRKYKVYLLRAHLHPLAQAQARHKVKIANDLELVIIFDIVYAELKQRGILDE